MASIIARRAFAQRALSQRAFSTSARRLSTNPALKEETKRNPELMILGGVMVLALGGAGLYFGRSPTGSTSEENVGMANSGMPWETGAGDGKYQYHPGGDPHAEPKDAPSAVNVVIVPNVNLPKELHDKYNKWGKDGY
ncbi:uncharacterized protein GGS25DRAFT_404686 [Hypoxylon fragiforme]|uniref:uncharacterized protein n=1 Tax=Hypoxylon fragiforme TaxID=63214 RepID=UPI0020C65BA3|nr:uncharacterized protein GGS25DRAFT_404686 [Hypoxylon fragiforme]KAI2604934.1 hypothetical protein GGS25DRAFT_404686 [Hypoxylon fragiforme]